MQHTFNCKHGLIITKPTRPTQLSRPKYCPCCKNTPSITETNGWDEYALRLNTSRQFAILMLNKFDRALDFKWLSNNSTNSGTPYTSPKYRHKSLSAIPKVDSLDNIELAERAMAALAPKYDRGVMFIHAHCKECASSIEFQVTGPDNVSNPTIQTTRRQLTYCPYCGIASLILTPASPTYTERSDQEWQYLADHYGQSVLAIRSYYLFWEKHSTLRTFKEFMEDLPNQLKLELTDPHTRRTIAATATIKSATARRPAPHKAAHKIKIVAKPNNSGANN